MTDRKEEKGFLKELDTMDTFQKPSTSEEVTDGREEKEFLEEINIVDIFQKSRIIHL